MVVMPVVQKPVLVAKTFKNPDLQFCFVELNVETCETLGGGNTLATTVDSLSLFVLCQIVLFLAPTLSIYT